MNFHKYYFFFFITAGSDPCDLAFNVTKCFYNVFPDVSEMKQKKNKKINSVMKIFTLYRNISYYRYKKS